VFFDKKIVVTSVYVFKFDFEKKKDVFVPGRNYHALTFRLGGKVEIEHDGKRLVSSEGSITYIPKDFSYTTRIIEDGSALGVHFTTADEYDGLSHDVISPSHPIVFRNMFSEIASRFKLGRENDLYCMSMFYEILAETRHEHNKKIGNIINPRIKKAKDRIDRGFSDPALLVSELAGEAQVSEVYFRREFGKAIGSSPAAYIKMVRIENAKAYLRTGLFSVTEVATKCGFDSISYFSCEFHRIVGMTPREYVAKYC
jgi:AraC-like DNA-binding protein